MERELGPVFLQFPEPLLVLDNSLHIRACNSAVEKTMGFSGEELAGKACCKYFSCADPARKKGKPGDLLRDVLQRNVVVEGAEFTLKKSKGEIVVEVDASPLEWDGLPGGRGILLVFRDVTLKHELLAGLEAEARTDALTGLGNRWQLEEYARRILAGASRHGEVTSLVVFDLDELKNINDSYGHQMGDRALKAVGEVLQGSLRGSDLAARFGGDEFLLLLPKLRASQAEKLVHRLQEKLARVDLSMATPIRLSYGIAELSPDETWEETFSRADADLYARRARGRNQLPKKVVQAAPPNSG